jgi:catechol 2,3-dioxygenase-like lactoylglutathione lyase family enzyme
VSETCGINHLGLAVLSLDKTTFFFVDLLGWTESGRDQEYPRTAVSDGAVRLTLWQIDHSLDVAEFHRRKNVGLHHLALEVESMSKLESLYEKLRAHPDVEIEFKPELVGPGPRVHMMCSEPGGIRIEFIWPGA